MKVVINPAYKEYASFIQNMPASFNDSGELIYKGRNELKRFVVNGTNVIVKSFKNPHIINRFVYVTFRSSKASRSYNYALKLLKEGINTPAPIGYIELYNKGLAESYYLSEEVADFRQVRDFCGETGLGDYPKIFEAFGLFTADMHQKKIVHKDYSPGNILYARKEDEVLFYLVDLNRMQFDRCLREEEGYANFQRLCFSNEGFELLAKTYASAMGYNEQHAIERICFYKNRFMANYIR